LKPQANAIPGLNGRRQVSAAALRAERSAPSVRIGAMDDGPFSNILNPGAWVLIGGVGMIIFMML